MPYREPGTLDAAEGFLVRPAPSRVSVPWIDLLGRRWGLRTYAVGDGLRRLESDVEIGPHVLTAAEEAIVSSLSAIGAGEGNAWLVYEDWSRAEYESAF